MIRRLLVALFLLTGTLFVGCQTAAPTGASADPALAVPQPSQSVLRVTVTHQSYSFYRPWMKQRPGTRQGLGAVVVGNYVLVTATLVEDAAFVELEKLDTGDQAPARVVCVDYMANLAVLACDREGFLEDMQPLELEPALEVGDQVSAWQFEDNGTPFITDGIIRTVETAPYPLQERNLLVYRVEISLSRLTSSYVIPMVRDGKLIGLLMSYNSNTRIMTVASGPVIRHFLEDFGSSSYQGFPQVGIGFAFLDDPQFRDYLGLSGIGGVYITDVHPMGAAAQAGIQRGDVLIAIDRHTIDRNGQYSDPVYGQLSLSHLVSTRTQVGETLTFRVIREGETLLIDVPVDVPSTEAAPIPEFIKSHPPNYLVQGGMVFLELSTDYLRQWGDGWQNKAPQRLRYYREHQWELLQPGQRLVFLSHVLPTPGNLGFHDLNNNPVEQINGREIHSLQDATEAFAEPANGFHNITFRDIGREVHLRAATVDQVNQQIQQLYQIEQLSRITTTP